LKEGRKKGREKRGKGGREKKEGTKMSCIRTKRKKELCAYPQHSKTTLRLNGWGIFYTCLKFEQ
jgi:hypothetical protein